MSVLFQASSFELIFPVLFSPPLPQYTRVLLESPLRRPLAKCTSSEFPSSGSRHYCSSLICPRFSPSYSAVSFPSSIFMIVSSFLRRIHLQHAASEFLLFSGSRRYCSLLLSHFPWYIYFFSFYLFLFWSVSSIFVIVWSFLRRVHLWY